MELTFSELKTKEVVNTQDGRKLGKVCDIVICYPENRWLGIIAPNGNGFSFKKNNVFIDLKNIVKIGEDVILVNVGLPIKPHGKKCAPPPPPAPPSPPPPPPPPPQPYGGMGGMGGMGGGRNFEEFE